MLPIRNERSMLPVPTNPTAHPGLTRTNSSHSQRAVRRIPSPMVGSRGSSARATDLYAINTPISDNRRLYHHGSSKSLTTNHHTPQTRRFPTEQVGNENEPRPVHDVEPFYQDWHRGRSYRDTTSEIISLYAHQSTYYGGTPSLYEDSGRSQSFSTSSSRHTPSQKSSGTLSGRSVSGLHPRSPAVYHGHLNRTVVRPESPIVIHDDYTNHQKIPKHDVSPHTVVPQYRTLPHQFVRRPPPLSLRSKNDRVGELTTSRSGGVNFNSAFMRSRTPSHAMATWTPQPPRRQHADSVIDSTRSASLTSIVDMYQRPLNSAGTCPPLRNHGTFYYDYSEDFEQQSNGILEMLPPNKTVATPAVAKTISGQYQDVGEDAGQDYHRHANDQHCQVDSISDNSYESYLQGSHDDSIREIEKVIADAIANVPTVDAINDTVRVEALDRTKLVDVTNVQQKSIQPSDRDETNSLPEGYKKAEARESHAKRNERLNETESSSDYKLDPAFADFSSLLSSFDRLAKSPFSKLSDDEDTDGEDMKRRSRQMTLELLDRVALESKAYKRRHRRNIAAMRISTMGFEADESTIDLQMSNNNSVLAPESLMPLQENGNQPRLMKELPPLPPEWTKVDATEDKENCPERTKDGHEKGEDEDDAEEDMPLTELPCLSNGSKKREHSRTPLRFKLRMNTSTSSVESEFVPDALKLKKDNIRSVDEEANGAKEQETKQPPRLKLKISRSQLGQGRASQQSGITRNNRLKQCNSLADVLVPAQQGIKRGIDENKVGSQRRGHDCSLDTINSEVSRLETSPQPSDQFNISYPPSLKKMSPKSRSNTVSSNESLSELQSAKSDLGPNGQRGLRQKLSYLRLRLTHNQSALPTKTKQVGSIANVVRENGTASLMEDIADVTEESNVQVKQGPRSVKSERPSSRVKRWANDAKRALRLYVRRTLIRPKHHGEEMQ